MRCSRRSARGWGVRRRRSSPRPAGCSKVLRYMSQHHLLDSNIHLASFDDHYLYDSLSLRIDTVQQDNRQLARHCYDLLSQLIDGQAPEPLPALSARHPADSPSLTARLAISVFARRAPPASAPAARWRAPRQGRSLPASGKATSNEGNPPSGASITRFQPASPRCRSAPGLTSADAGRMAEWSGSGCRTAGLHLSRELRLHLGQHAGRQRVRCRQQMPVAIHQQQLIMPLPGEGLESGAHRRQRPVASRCGAGMFIRRSRRSATHCASSSSWRICLSR